MRISSVKYPDSTVPRASWLAVAYLVAVSAWAASLAQVGEGRDGIATPAFELTGHRPHPVTVEIPAFELTGHRLSPLTVDTISFELTGHRAAPITVDTEAFRLTGHRPEPTALDTDSFELTGFRVAPVELDTAAFELTGHRPAPVMLDTEAFELTGHRPDPVTVDTEAFRLTGYRPDSIETRTDAFQLTGYGHGPATVDTDAFELTGHRPDPVRLDTSAFRLTGHRPGAVSLDTSAFELTGYRAGPFTLDTEAFELTGHRPGPATLDTDAFRLTGHRPEPFSLDTESFALTGHRPGPVTLDTDSFALTGYGGVRDVEPLPADLVLLKTGPDICDTAERCRFDFSFRNVREERLEGLISFRDVPDVDGARLAGAGPDVGTWACLHFRGERSLTCVSTLIGIEAGAEVSLFLEFELPSSLATGSELENCAELARLEPGTNPVLFTQFMLTRLGIDPGPIDGIMGGKTSTGISEFQTRRGLPVTGEVDAALVGALSALMVRDGNPRNDRACTSVGITRTITCGFGEQVAGDRCEPICTARGSHWNGGRCVTCGSGERWNADRLACEERPPDCDTGTTVLRGNECRCAYSDMERVSETRCRCPSGTELVSGEGCVTPQPQCPFGQVYNARTGACDFICIPPGFSTASGCACPDGQQYRLLRGGCPEPRTDQRGNRRQN